MAFFWLLATLLLLRGIERLNGTAFFARRLAVELARLGVHVGLFGLLFGLSGRPVTSMATATLIVAGFAAASAAKQAVVFEPVVFSDLGLLGQVVRYPKLYLLDRWPLLLLGAIAVLSLLGLAFWFEPPTDRSSLALLCVFCGALAACLWRRRIAARYAPLLLDATTGWGMQQLGLLTALLLQTLCWRTEPALVRADAPVAFAQPPQPCDIVVIQLESFVDLAPHLAGHGSAWATLQNQSRLYGKLDVLARGANTMRTEHGVLSAIAEAALRFDRFDPYLRKPASSYGVATRLRHWGWHTSFIHPNDLGFFRRDRVLPSLGFDTMIGAAAFAGAPRVGPYIGDMAVSQAIATQIQTGTPPQFIFAVTMENHGPWKAGRLPGRAGGLDAYLAHQASTDEALLWLLDRLRQSPRRTILVLYGDHGPAIAGLPATLPPDQTDYLILDTRPPGTASPFVRTLSPATLLQTAIALI